MNTERLESYPDILSVQDLCKILDISTGTAYKLLKGQYGTKLPSRKIGRHYRILKSDLMHLFQDE